MSKLLVIEPEKCTGCLSCVLSCSFAHTKKFSMQSRISIKKNKYEGESEINVCKQCDDAPCASACPADALIKNDKTGEVEFNADKCVGCKECISACPFNAITFNIEENIIEKCNLCGGDPMCAKVCTTGAITYVEVN